MSRPFDLRSLVTTVTVVLLASLGPAAGASPTPSATGQATAVVPPGQRRPVFFVGVTTDAAQKVQTLKADYRHDAASVIAQAAATQGLLVGDLIRPESLAVDLLPTDVTFAPPPSLPAGNSEYLQAYEGSMRAKAGQEVASMLDGPYAAGVDVLGECAVAAEVFGAAPHVSGRDLVLLSPMADSTVTNALAGDYSPTHVHAVISALRSQGMVPDLRGVDVYVAGAGVEPGVTDTALDVGLQRFWKRYFSATGANLVTYASRLLTLSRAVGLRRAR